MFAKWLEEYQRLSKKTRFISQLGTFLVSLLAFLSCWRLIDAAYQNPTALNFLWNNILVSVICHLTIGTIFIRFVLLLLNSKRSFWFAQIFWMIGIFAIFGYFTATRFAIWGSFFRPTTEISFGMDDYPVLFLYASYSFVVFVCIYFFASPIRQIITAFIAFNKSK